MQGSDNPAIRTEFIDDDSATILVVADLFQAIGFDVRDDSSYNSLAETAETCGWRSTTRRGDLILEGRCWKLGDGLEVWSILYERNGETHYADCRPGFRSRYVHSMHPWELIEYDDDGEAILRGLVGGTDQVFELQNLTEVEQSVFREQELSVGVAGLAYNGVIRPHLSANPAGKFELAESVVEMQNEACENDYIVAGRIISWRHLKNPVTSVRLLWLHVDTGVGAIEVISNRTSIRGRPQVGHHFEGTLWLQGHVLDSTAVASRYEGVDPDFEAGDFWSRLRRGN